MPRYKDYSYDQGRKEDLEPRVVAVEAPKPGQQRVTTSEQIGSAF
jgi:hypothetical protein